uniref:Uncharacterized protein n=1 Tax=Arion vulgaris TaxID=1028688 RepID=A0A0B7A192_9EUPU
MIHSNMCSTSTTKMCYDDHTTFVTANNKTKDEGSFLPKPTKQKLVKLIYIYHIFHNVIKVVFVMTIISLFTGS